MILKYRFNFFCRPDSFIAKEACFAVLKRHIIQQELRVYAQCPLSLYYLISFPSEANPARIRFSVATDTPHNIRIQSIYAFN